MGVLKLRALLFWGVYIGLQRSLETPTCSYGPENSQRTNFSASPLKGLNRDPVKSLPGEPGLVASRARSTQTILIHMLTLVLGLFTSTYAPPSRSP